MWFCHECNAEMRPLMVPDPVCASCHGAFVEKMEDPADDPREFQRGDFGGGGEIPLGLEAFLYALSDAAARGPSRSTRTFEFRNGATGRSIRVGSGGAPVDEDPDQPTMADFLQRRPSEGSGGGINGSLMARYLMALLGGRDIMTDMLAQGEGAQPGRMGDYVFNQEALDEIITQLMESNNNATRPVPATDEILEKLPREVLEAGSGTLEKDCAICQEQFKLETEDPDEQVVVTLPCDAHHSFHEPCIMPWLKSSGTCPVCRYALVPQPEHHGPPPANAGASTSRGPAPPGGPGGALFQTLFGQVANGASSASGSRSRRRASSDTPRGSGNNHIPGGWEEDLD
uniref:RING-type domain-containing protein n=1 Tax=Mycena chlorophos TaxID=658473 RepID=A0ABQ0M2E7_MYCCL|nr:predicted protein [Mycena chlorophos]